MVLKKNVQLKDVSWAEEWAENIYQREKHLESKGEKKQKQHCSAEWMRVQYDTLLGAERKNK